MALCYQKEVFISGFLTAYLLFVMMAFFEDTISGWLRRFIKFWGLNRYEWK